MRLFLPALALLMSACGIHLEAATVEVRLTTGELVTGEVVEETANSLKLKYFVVMRYKPSEVFMTVDKSSITSRKAVPSITEQYETRRSTAQSTLLGQCAIARWCLDRALTEQALVHTRQAEQIDRFSPIVTKLYGDLGYLKVDDAWVLESEHLAKTGKVKVGDRLLTKEEATQVREQAANNASVARLEQQIRDAEWAIKNGERRLAEATARRDQAKTELTKAEAEAKGAANRRDQLLRRLEARSAQDKNNRIQERDQQDQASLRQAASDASRATAAHKKWQQDLEEAQKELEKVKTSVDKAKAALPELQKQLTEAGGKKADAQVGKPATPSGEKPGEKGEDRSATDKPKNRFGGADSDKPSDKTEDRPETDKPKNRFGAE